MLLRLAPGRKILTYCLMAGIPLLFQMTIVTFRDGFLDAGVSDAVCRVENGPARGLHTTPERRTLINDIMRIKETAPDTSTAPAVRSGATHHSQSMTILRTGARTERVKYSTFN